MNLSRRPLRWSLVAISALTVWSGNRVEAALRVVSYNIDCDTSTFPKDAKGLPFYLDTVLQGIGNTHLNGNAQPLDVLSLQELQLLYSTPPTLSPTLSAIVAELNAIYGPGTYACDTYAGQTTGNSTGNGPNGLIYNTKTVQDIAAVGIGTARSAGAPRQPIRYQLRPIGYDGDADFYIYDSHYKASSDSNNPDRRNIEATTIRADADALPPNSHIIYAGDFNFTSGPTEPAYLTLLANGNGQAHDPLGTTWTNSSNANGIMTESADALTIRFDFQLISGAVQNQPGLQLIPNTYSAFGNNGSVAKNSAINVAGNTALSDLINRTDILNYMVTSVSDHLPVVADYQVVGLVNGAWSSTAAGWWSTAGSWSSNAIANGSRFTATFAAASGSLTVHLDSARKVGHLIFGNTAGSALAGWTLDNNANAANVLTLADSASAPSITVNTLGTGQSVTISASLAGTQGLLKNGSGSLVLSGANSYTGGTTISGGTLIFSGASARPGGTLTLGLDTKSKGAVVVLLTGENANAVRLELFNNTIRATPGAAAAKQGVGYLTTEQYNSLHGTTLTAGGVIAKYTFLGDTTLKGYVDAGDFAQLDAAFLKGTYANGGAAWINGDFNYDGKITAADFIALDAAYIAGKNGALASDPFLTYNAMLLGLSAAEYASLVSAQLAASVPEPASLCLLAGGGLMLRRRRLR